MVDLTVDERVELYGSADLAPNHGWNPDLSKFVAVQFALTEMNLTRDELFAKYKAASST